MSTRLSFAGLLAGLLYLCQLAAAASPDAPAHTSDGLVTVTYAVADLVVPVPGTPAVKLGKTQEDRLISVLQSTASPTSWVGYGGQGTIDYFPLTMALVVKQSPAVHRELSRVLEQLRKMQDTEVTVEMRFISVTDECMQKLGIEAEESEKGATPGVVNLDDTQVRVLLETVQGDRAANVMQAPKLTCFNGQQATINLTENQSFVTGIDVVQASGQKKSFLPKTTKIETGFRVNVLPTVSIDSKSVTMQLGVHLTRMDSPKVPVHPVVCGEVCEPGEKPLVLTQFVQQPRCSSFAVETSLKVADGATVLLTGWKHHREVRNEIAPPLLAKIPYVGQLFRTVAYSRQKEHLLVMVTPRIITRPEEAQEGAAPLPQKPVPATTGLVPASVTIDADESPRPLPRVKAPVVYSEGRSFRLSYDVSDATEWKELRGVEVWYTRDGQKWDRYPEEVKPTGSVPVTVRAPGRWGFTLIVRGKGGQGGPGPFVGDEPQVWVEAGKATNPDVCGIPSVRAVTVQPRD
jgi:hypothetical protein